MSGTTTAAPEGQALVEGFGLAVRQAREAVGLSQDELARRAGLNRSHVGEVERGSAIASLLTAHKLAAALRLRLPALVEEGERLARRDDVRRLTLASFAC